MNPFTAPRNRWFTVLAGALGCAAGAGVVASYVFGIFIKAISAEYGWDRSITTASILCFYFGIGIGSVSLGHVMARWGVRPSAILFATLFCVSLALVAALPQSVLLFCLLFGVMGFFGAAASALPYSIAIAAWFDKNRGLALALAVSGGGVSAIFMSSYANWLMEQFGWRGAYVGVALFCAFVALFGLLFFFRMPARDPAAAAPPRPAPLRQIMSTPAFIKIGVSIFLISIALMGCITNLAPLLTDRGKTMGEAAAMLGLLGAGSWIGRISVGILLDRFHVRYVSTGVFLMVALGIAALWLMPNDTGAIIAVVTVGIGIGCEADLIAFAMSRYYRPSDLSPAMGGGFLLWSWGAGLGVLFGSLSFDMTGSYTTALIIYIVLALISAVVVMTLGRYTETSTGH